MNKKFLSIASLALCGAMIFSVGCTNSSDLDSEERRLKLSSNTLDGNFNPFFYTSSNDGEIASMTQLPLMTTDARGNLSYGQDAACVALDYKATTYDANHVVSANGDMAGTTEYEIVIKNGIKFSDGIDLTIKDVLFNFYVYLDPAYTGSATIYSTDIVGLNAYRAQDPDKRDDADADISTSFVTRAQNRINYLIEWADTNGLQETALTQQGQKDLATVRRLFAEEAESDWNTYSTGWEDIYGDDSLYNFAHEWQAYLFAEGIITVQTRTNLQGAIEQIKDADGKYLTTLDPYVSGTNAGQVGAKPYIDGIAEATTETKVSAYAQEHNVSSEVALLQLKKEYCLNVVIGNYTDKTEIADVLRYWATGSNVLTELTGEERTDHYNDIREENNGKPLVPSVSGITTYKRNTDLSGNPLGAEHDVLKIVINGVDPKAVWNFCFSIAPLHHYSGTYNGFDYVSNFNGTDNFGVLVGSSDFYNTVLRDTSKNGVPVGAGPYMTSSADGEHSTTRGDFFSNNVVYFMRNEYFNTVGTGIENAKIKYISYSVMSDASIVDALKTNQIDYGEPSATGANQTEVTGQEHLRATSYRNAGYGYVGINPKYVPEVKVRQAIMRALNTRLTVSYYGESLAESIFRPLSLTSWVYDDERARLTSEYAETKYTTVDQDIIDLVVDAGYTSVNANGVRQNSRGDTLTYTFTIAGESQDHPAYGMFTQAASRLNRLGFDINVQTDITALTKLSSGSLAVWAAAWSSSIDPDMYQVYHKDSQATSVNNWNYPAIKSNPTNWAYELPIINTLSNKIDDARETLNQQTRSSLYADCLDLVMSLAIELPTYQRSTLAVYNNNVLDRNTMTAEPSFNLGLIDRIWELDYIK